MQDCGSSSIWMQNKHALIQSPTGHVSFEDGNTSLMFSQGETPDWSGKRYQSLEKCVWGHVSWENTYHCNNSSAIPIPHVLISHSLFLLLEWICYNALHGRDWYSKGVRDLDRVIAKDWAETSKNACLYSNRGLWSSALPSVTFLGLSISPYADLQSMTI